MRKQIIIGLICVLLTAVHAFAAGPVIVSDPQLVQQMIDARDQRVIPTLLLWLGAEQDGRRVGTGSVRLKMAIDGADKLAIGEAVPYLGMIVDEPTATTTMMERALTALLRIDPDYPPARLRPMLSEARAGRNRYGIRTTITIAAALAARGDKEGREFLADALTAYLQREMGTADNGLEQCVVELNRLDDPQMIEIITPIIRDEAGNSDQLKMKRLLLQMQANHESVAALRARIARAGGDELEFQCALTALGHKGEATEIDLFTPLFRNTSSAQTALSAIDELERRWHVYHRLAAADKVFNAKTPATSPALPEGLETSQAYAYQGLNRRAVGGKQVMVVNLLALNGHSTSRYLIADNDRIEQAAKACMPESVVVASIDAKAERIFSLTPMNERPGEASPFGYIFVSHQKFENDPDASSGVILRKLGREFSAAVPPADGRVLKLVGQTSKCLAECRPGDVVDARFYVMSGRKYLVSLAPYQPRMRGRFVQFARMDVDHVSQKCVVVESGGKQITLVYPDANTPPGQALSIELLRQIFTGCAVNWIVDPDRPQFLREFLVDGDVSTRWNEPTYMFVSGRAQATASWSNGQPRSGGLTTGGYDTEASRLVSGLVRLRDDPKLLSNMDPDTRKQAIQTLQSHANTQKFAETINQCGMKWLTAHGDLDRAAAEQEIFFVLQQVHADVNEKDQDQIEKVKSLLTPDEYAIVLRAAPQHRDPILPRRQRPTTRP